MSYDLDSVLKPYADDQPKISMIPSKAKSCNITRMPPLATVGTPGGINPQFQEFYDNIVDAFSDITHLYKKLYELSDKAVYEDEFEIMLYKTIGKGMIEFCSSPRNRCGLDIELNLGRFEQKHRNLIGGLYVITYRLVDSQFDGIDCDTQLEQKYTELLFTYKDNEFVLITNFTAFTNVVDE